MPEQKLFELACAGNTEALAELYKNGCSMDAAYYKFGEPHSLVMGAYRNRQWDTVRWLLKHGAKLTDTEQEEVNNRYMEMELLSEMQDMSETKGLQ